MGAQRVLVVEDQDDIAEILRTLLEDRGVDVRVAGDGETALEVLPTFRPDLMLVDLSLPGIDGEEVARRVRAGGGVEPRLVALTGHEADEVRTRCLDAGFDVFSVKPFGLEALEKAIDSWLG